MIKSAYVRFTGKIDRRGPRDSIENDVVYMRENLLCRDGVLKCPSGTQRAISTTLTDIPTWIGRYFSFEVGVTPFKTFVYTQDGKMWVKNDQARTCAVASTGYNAKAFPKHWIFKKQDQNIMYWVDGESLYRYDGNDGNTFQKVTLEDSDGNSVAPIDLIEHRDRLVVISNAYVFISKNLEPDVFDDATDSVQIIVGSGKGKNLALGKINNVLYIFNTEGIFAIAGDVISAVATTFEVRLIHERRIIAGRTLKKVENALLFLADDYNVWSFDGASTTKLSHSEKLEDSVNYYRDQLNKAVATYYDNYYMLSFVEKGAASINNLEFWWDALENKSDFVRGRNVSCYLEIDKTNEVGYLETGRSDTGTIMACDIGYNFDNAPIQIRLWTKDITPTKGENVRFYDFMPEIQPYAGDPATAQKTVSIAYLLDGRLSSPISPDSSADFVYSGLLPGTGAIAAATISAGKAYIHGTTVSKATTTTPGAGNYTASRYIFVDLGDDGNFYYTVTALGAADPAVYATAFVKCIRLGRVTTNATDVTAVRDDRVIDSAEAPVQWAQSLVGEDRKLYQFVTIKNQSQVMYCYKPRINYARGTSIAFLIDMKLLNLRFALLGMNIQFIPKQTKRGRKVAQ